VFNFHQIAPGAAPRRPNPDVRALSSVAFGSYNVGVTRLLVALLLGLAMPVAQLQLVHVERWCCCPDQTKCHCPDDGDPSPQSSMKSCHETERVVTSTPMAAFGPPVLAGVDVIAPVARVIDHATSEPHAPPAPRRPDAPS